LLLFQEYEFEVVIKSGRINAGLDHLSQIETSEEPTNLEEGLLDAQLYAVRIADGHFEDIIHFLTTRTASQGYSIQQKKELVIHVADFTVIAGHLYKMATMKPYVDICLNSSMDKYLPKHMAGWRENILQVTLLHRRFFTQDYGGQPYIKTRKHTVGPATSVNKLGNHHREMKCRSSHK